MALPRQYFEIFESYVDPTLIPYKVLKRLLSGLAIQE